MAKIKGFIKSLMLVLIGFYIRGMIDNFSAQQRWINENEIDDLVGLGIVNTRTNAQSSYNQNNAETSQANLIRKIQINKEQNPNSKDGPRHWCVIATKFLPKTTRGHFDHFPHAAEIILPCWSYFVKQNVIDRCGFAIASQNLAFPSWIQQLVDAMGCEVKTGGGMPKNTNNLIDFVPEEDIQYIPNYYLLRPRLDYIRYLDHPEHAHILRRMFVDDEYINEIKGNGKPKQIGIIQREGARRIDNLDKILRILRKDIDESLANITVTEFKFKTVKEQATWFATKDMIIASHGAALTNSVFITPGTIVMQMYPPGYFLQTLEVSFMSLLCVLKFQRSLKPCDNMF